MKFKFYIFFPFVCFLLIGCGDDPVAKKSVQVDADSIPNKQVTKKDIATEIEFDFPKVSIEQLDHSQEFYKEQHTTSFSYVPKKNWTSFTASKNGLLTKVLLFGKANLLESPHYGLSMSGFVRANNPDSGPKYGKWILSREEIVAQLAAQGLGPRESGWLTIRMRGEIPQKVGTRYFLVCDKITENKAWFGEFAFAEANPYEFGSHWLNKEHDLVLRTYVGKTDEQLKSMQLEDSSSNVNNAQDELLPIPISQELRDQNLPQNPSTPPSNTISPQEVDNQSANSSKEDDDSNRSRKKTMFERLFKKDKRD